MHTFNLNSSNMNDDFQQLFFCLCCVAVIFNISVIRLLVARRFCLVASWLVARGFLGGKFVGGETP